MYMFDLIPLSDWALLVESNTVRQFNDRQKHT